VLERRAVAAAELVEQQVVACGSGRWLVSSGRVRILGLSVGFLTAGHRGGWGVQLLVGEARGGSLPVKEEEARRGRGRRGARGRGE
jgi:hypothetical protein